MHLYVICYKTNKCLKKKLWWSGKLLNMSFIFKSCGSFDAVLLKHVLGPGALRRPRGLWWRGRWEGRSGWGIHVYPWLIHVNV